MKKFSDWKISTKLIALTLAALVPIILNLKGFADTEDQFFEDKKREVKSVVDVGYTILEQCYFKMESGELNPEEAEKRLADDLNAIRYSGREYFFAYDLNGNTKALGSNPALVGTNRFNLKDPTGTLILQDMIKLVKTQREGFLYYHYPKLGETDPKPKISYLKLHPEWKIFIGSGVYLDDVEAKIASYRTNVLIIILVATVIAVAIGYVIVRFILRPVTALKIATDKATAGDYSCVTNISSRDEIGALSTAFNTMLNTIKHHILELETYNQKQSRLITELQEAEALRTESEERFSTLFENMTEGVALHELVYNEKGEYINYRILDINPAYQKHTGLERSYAVNKLATELYGTPTPPYLNEFCSVGNTREPYRFETYFPPMKRHFNISVISPKRGYFATVFEDITDRIQREEELKQKNEDLTRFIYTVSHDLKSPLVTIKAFAGYLEEDIEAGDRERTEKDLGYIVNAADKMGTLLDELLELSRIGRKDPPKKEVPLSQIVDAVLELLAGQIKGNNITIGYDTQGVILWCEQQRMMQLFQNLIDNAIKYMGNQPEPRIEIGYQNNDRGITLFVKDNGKGIDPRYAHKVFGLFEKLDQSAGGTGIGLALVKRIVEMHNGSVWFESEGEGKGTTFFISLAETKLVTDAEPETRKESS